MWAYGPPAFLLSGNGTQFTSKLFQLMCSTIGVKNLFTATYHPQTNGQVERFNRTLLARIRAFCAEQPKSWDEHIGGLTYAYNIQVHSSAGIAPFRLVILRPPAGIANRQDLWINADSVEPSKVADRFKHMVVEFSKRSSKNLAKAQARYKHNYGKKVRLAKRNAVEGDWVFLTRQGPSCAHPADAPRRHKLHSKATGPYLVVGHTEHNLQIIRDDRMVENVTRDRISTAPRQPQQRIDLYCQQRMTKIERLAQCAPGTSTTMLTTTCRKRRYSLSKRSTSTSLSWIASLSSGSVTNIAMNGRKNRQRTFHTTYNSCISAEKDSRCRHT